MLFSIHSSFVSHGGEVSFDKLENRSKFGLSMWKSSDRRLQCRTKKTVESSTSKNSNFHRTAHFVMFEFIFELRKHRNELRDEWERRTEKVSHPHKWKLKTVKLKIHHQHWLLYDFREDPAKLSDKSDRLQHAWTFQSRTIVDFWRNNTVYLQKKFWHSNTANPFHPRQVRKREKKWEVVQLEQCTRTRTQVQRRRQRRMEWAVTRRQTVRRQRCDAAAMHWWSSKVTSSLSEFGVYQPQCCQRYSVSLHRV